MVSIKEHLTRMYCIRMSLLVLKFSQHFILNGARTDNSACTTGKVYAV